MKSLAKAVLVMSIFVAASSQAKTCRRSAQSMATKAVKHGSDVQSFSDMKQRPPIEQSNAARRRVLASAKVL